MINFAYQRFYEVLLVLEFKMSLLKRSLLQSDGHLRVTRKAKPQSNQLLNGKFRKVSNATS